MLGNAELLLSPNEGINQRNLKSWADVADKICYPKDFGEGVDFQPCSEGDFLTWGIHSP